MKSLALWEEHLLPSATRIAAVILRYLPTDGVLVDAGANTGLLTSLVLQQCPHMHGVLFEPVRRYYNACHARFADFAHVRTVHCGLSDSAGAMTIYCHDRNLGMNTLDTVTARGLTASETITLATLDSFALPRIDVLKIDVEGWEGKLLHGARETLARCHPVIIMEWSRGSTLALWREKIAEIEWLFAQGYQRIPYDIDGTADLVIVPEV